MCLGEAAAAGGGSLGGSRPEVRSEVAAPCVDFMVVSSFDSKVASLPSIEFMRPPTRVSTEVIFVRRDSPFDSTVDARVVILSSSFGKRRFVTWPWLLAISARTDLMATTMASPREASIAAVTAAVTALFTVDTMVAVIADERVSMAVADAKMSSSSTLTVALTPTPNVVVAKVAPGGAPPSIASSTAATPPSGGVSNPGDS